MKHIVFGAGLIGGYLGGVLTSLNHDTIMVCRPSVKEKLNVGLLLTDYLHNSTKVNNLNIIDSTQKVKALRADFLWITVKCTSIKNIISDIKPYIGEHTIIFCCQNGLGSDQPIRNAYPQNTVLRVMFPFNVAEPRHGHLHRGSEGDVYIENTNNVEAINNLLPTIQSPFMTIKQTSEMDNLLWAKLQLNLANSVNALADIPVLEMLMDRDYRKVIATLQKELLSVTRVSGIKLPKLTALPPQFLPKVLQVPTPIYKTLTKKVLNIDPTVRTSMWWDLSQGKPTEIDHLNGAVVKEGNKYNISCPANQIIIDLIKKNEGLAEKRKKYSGKQLLEMINQ